MRKNIFLFMLLFYSFGISAQQVELSLPYMAGKEAKIAYFHGSRSDTLSTMLDTAGKGSLRLPDGYKGIVQLIVPDFGSTEFIGGEPLVKVESDMEYISKDNVRFPDSRENELLYRFFAEKSENMTRMAWIQNGLQLNKPETELYRLLTEEFKSIQEQSVIIDKQINESSSYAASLIQIMVFSNILMSANDTHNPQQIAQVRAYLHKDMDWQALYTSRDFWSMTTSLYINLFDAGTASQKEEEVNYAKEVAQLTAKVQEPVRSALFESLYRACEGLDWNIAKDSMMSYIAQNGTEINLHDNYMQWIHTEYRTRTGNPAPEIEGVEMRNRDGGTSLVIFYESGCGSCESELEEIILHYPQLLKKGVRIITVSADVDKRTYDFNSRNFLWKDKLCDFKGFSGNNFKNYGIMATPTMFVIDRNGIIAGRYASLENTGLLKK
ncbi:hypothetical protein D0T84_09170 [Dysgonomonas sp. 521]|uniref:peroxiredoxin family protein n=1 Tax=Dysgonomonas sp. 521 TaxID=2302932 RepID=UPI0013D014E8|nr:redoxin domain-containing protein [Dysgonomonas sp. 521]NDV95088.1 hypothetical protein [Dysgonomonas sp. 521]